VLLLITPISYYCCTLLCSSVVYDAVLGISLSMMKLGNGTTMENWRGVSSDAKHVSIFSSVRTKLLE
jgi:hypothetical protein